MRSAGGGRLARPEGKGKFDRNCTYPKIEMAPELQNVLLVKQRAALNKEMPRGGGK